jgi:hypothetical protein
VALFLVAGRCFPASRYVLRLLSGPLAIVIFLAAFTHYPTLFVSGQCISYLVSWGYGSVSTTKMRFGHNKLVESDAVIRALIKSTPYIFIGVVLVVFSLWSKNTSNPEYMRLLGVLTLHIFGCGYFVMVCPSASWLCRSYFLNRNKNHKNWLLSATRHCCIQGHDCQERDNIDISWSCALGVTVFALFVVYLGNNAYTAVAGGKNMHEIIDKLATKCHYEK